MLYEVVNRARKALGMAVTMAATWVMMTLVTRMTVRVTATGVMVTLMTRVPVPMSVIFENMSIRLVVVAARAAAARIFPTALTTHRLKLSTSPRSLP